MDWIETLATIIVFSSLGAFIDFLLGKAGQKRVRDNLETWWLKFEYVNKNNFGRKEAINALSVIDRIAGPSLFSWRRIKTVSFVSVFAVIFCWLTVNAASNRNLPLFPDYYPGLESITLVIAAAIIFSLALSANRIYCLLIIKLCGDGITRNILASISMILMTYLIFMLSSEFSILLVHYPLFALLAYSGDDNFSKYEVVIEALGLAKAVFMEMELLSFGAFKDNIRSALGTGASEHLWNAVAPRVYFFLAYIPTFFRVFLAIIFLASFIFKPFHILISLLWQRLLESEKPVFTIIFFGISGTAKIVRWFLEKM